MKVCLIRPPYSFYGSAYPKIDFPVGLLYIASSLEKAGHSVELVDGLLYECEEFVKGNKNYLFAAWKRIERKIKTSDADIFGITCLYTVQFPNVVKTARIIKKIKPKAKIIAGGPHVSVAYEEIIRDYKDIDILVRGEGEFTFTELLSKLEKGQDISDVKGIVFRKNGEVKITEPAVPPQNLDELPFPAYHLIDMEKYFLISKKYPSRTRFIYQGSERGITLITSRGCPYRCCFCSIHLHMGYRWRANSSEYVLKHMHFLIEKYRVNYFHFEDDNFTLDRKRFETILDGIIANGWKIMWDTPNGIRADTLDRNLIRKMKKSGCTFIILGIESGVQRVLKDVIHKNLDLTRVKEVVQTARKEKLHVRAFYIIGLPGETRNEIKQTVDFAYKLNDEYDVLGGIAFAVPLPGTELYRICKERNYLTKPLTAENIANGYLREGLIKTEEFDPQFLKNVVRRNPWIFKWIKFKKIIKFCIADPWLIFYFLKSFIQRPQNWRHYLSEIAYWRFLI